MLSVRPRRTIIVTSNGRPDDQNNQSECQNNQLLLHDENGHF
jgi:hypothetical protein